MTDGPDKKSVEHLLALYCDNELGPEERAEFEKVLAADPALQAEVELQSRIDASLRGAFGADNVEGIAADVDGIEAFKRPNSRTRLIWRVAAVLLFAVTIGVVYVEYQREFGTGPDSGTTTIQASTMQDYYDQAVASGFRPGWACSGEQFASTFQGQFGERLVLENVPANIKLSGLGYARIRSMQTVSIYASVDDKPVLLFAEPASTPGVLSPMKNGMYRHERELGPMLIHEVSPFAEPKILKYITIEEQ